MSRILAEFQIYVSIWHLLNNVKFSLVQMQIAVEFSKNSEFLKKQMALPNLKGFTEAFFTFIKYFFYGAIPVHEILLQFFKCFSFSPPELYSLHCQLLNVSPAVFDQVFAVIQMLLLQSSTYNLTIIIFNRT